VNYLLLLQFLSELTRFFQKSKAASKSVQLTMKKCKDMLCFLVIHVGTDIYQLCH